MGSFENVSIMMGCPSSSGTQDISEKGRKTLQLMSCVPDDEGMPFIIRDTRHIRKRKENITTDVLCP
jgi:hypothetical protein